MERRGQSRARVSSLQTWWNTKYVHALLQCTLSYRHNEGRLKFLEVLQYKGIPEIQNAQGEEQIFITIMGYHDTEVLQLLSAGTLCKQDF